MFRRASNSTFRRNVSWQFVGTATQSLLSGVVLLVMGRTLGASGFGQYSIIIGFITVANLLMEPRMQDVAARALWNLESEPAARSAHREPFIDLLAFESALKVVPMLAVTLLSLPLAQLANLPNGSAQLISIAAVGNYLAKIGYGASTGVLRVLGRSDQFTYCASGELLARFAALSVLASLGLLTVTTSVVVLSVTLALSNFVQLWLAIRHLGGLHGALTAWNIRTMPRRLVEHRRLLLSNIGLSAADLMNKDLDVTMLSPIMPAANIGIYKMAKNIALLTWRAVDPFYLALMPELIRRVQMNDFRGTYSLIQRSAIGLGVLATVLSGSAWLIVQSFGVILLGPAFVGITDLLMWMLIGIVGSAPLVWGHPLAVAINRGDMAFIGSVIGSSIGFVAFLILVSSFGINGAAVSWSLTFLPGFVFTAIAARRILHDRTTRAPSTSVAA